MTDDGDTHADAGPGTSTAARFALAAGGGLFLGAALLLWASQGAAVFAETAFAALVACF